MPSPALWGHPKNRPLGHLCPPLKVSEVRGEGREASGIGLDKGAGALWTLTETRVATTLTAPVPTVTYWTWLSAMPVPL